MNKIELRKKMRQLRSSISLEQKTLFSEKIAHHIFDHALFKSAKNIACYCDFNNEVVTKLIIEKIWAEKKFCYLPVLHRANSETLIFIQNEKDDKLNPNRFGILEPRYSENKIIAAKNLDLVFMPLVAFNRKGDRLGMGAGYYDRTFSFMKNAALSKPLLIGLAYASQEIFEIPVDSWDVRLNGIVTENGWVNF